MDIQISLFPFIEEGKEVTKLLSLNKPIREQILKHRNKYIHQKVLRLKDLNLAYHPQEKHSSAFLLCNFVNTYGYSADQDAIFKNLPFLVYASSDNEKSSTLHISNNVRLTVDHFYLDSDFQNTHVHVKNLFTKFKLTKAAKFAAVDRLYPDNNFPNLDI